MEKKNYLDHLRKWKGVELKYELWYNCRKIDSENNPMVKLVDNTLRVRWVLKLSSESIYYWKIYDISKAARDSRVPQMEDNESGPPAAVITYMV
jgi:hypothetical protein